MTAHYLNFMSNFHLVWRFSLHLWLSELICLSLPDVGCICHLKKKIHLLSFDKDKFLLDFQDERENQFFSKTREIMPSWMRVSE